MCRKCRSENQEDVIEKCPVCRTNFQMAEAIHGRSYDRTFQNVEHPMLKQLLTLELKCWKPQLKEAERQAAEDSDELSETQKLLLMANDVQTHHSHGVAGLSDTVVYNGKTDVSLGETEQLCFCSAGRDTHGSGLSRSPTPEEISGTRSCSAVRHATCAGGTRSVWFLEMGMQAS
uniref:Uncharacterized protein n=1 Tax=Haptolina brevifila TaxID=156173 RepID=A0A7S2J9A7_9EUKA|mmetsp:Transcript_78638/g.156325  ORF Transcript_78638/g.156325 Transcript_78638/m.156325 type:complete len:175 (+) Transcript_78638:575-1099(+)